MAGVLLNGEDQVYHDEERACAALGAILAAIQSPRLAIATRACCRELGRGEFTARPRTCHTSLCTVHPSPGLSLTYAERASMSVVRAVAEAVLPSRWAPRCPSVLTRSM
jgi:hypothetical protein